MATDNILDSAINLFATPEYATYISDANNKRKRSESELNDVYSKFVEFKQGLIRVGMLEDSKGGSLQFGMDDIKRRIRAIPFYSPPYLRFLSVDKNCAAKFSENNLPNEFNAPVFRFSLASSEIASLPISGNPYIFEGMASVFGSTILDHHAAMMFPAPKIIRVFEAISANMDKILEDGGAAVTVKNRTALFAMTHFLNSGKSCWTNLSGMTEREIRTALTYIIEAIKNDVPILKLMLALSASNHTNAQMGDKKNFTPAFSVEMLVEAKDIPATYLQRLLSV